VSEEFGQTDLLDPFLEYAPATLGPGESWEGPIVHLSVSQTAPVGITVFDIEVYGGGHDAASERIGLTFMAVDDSTPVSDVAHESGRCRRNPGGTQPVRGSQVIEFSSTAVPAAELTVFGRVRPPCAPGFSRDRYPRGCIAMHGTAGTTAEET
jgi:hypothetical protein